jgi:MORN repeat protein
VAAVLLVLLTGACTGPVRARDFRLPVDPDAEDPGAEPKLRIHRSMHPGTQETSARWTVLRWPDGRVLKHGLEERFFPDGTPRARRHFDRGQPTGEWRSWYSNGVLRSEYDYDSAGAPTIMRFFHSNGRPSAEGPARRGIREGDWSFWYEDGTLRQGGSYRAGRRSGVWTLRWDGGGLRSRGHYLDDARVGEWRHWAPSPATLEDPWMPPPPEHPGSRP